MESGINNNEDVSVVLSQKLSQSSLDETDEKSTDEKSSEDNIGEFFLFFLLC